MSDYQSTRSITAMHPRLRSLYIQFDTLMRQARIDYIVTATYRSNEDQAALYASGRTVRGKIRTNAIPGQSAHNALDTIGAPASRAFDIAIFKHGKIDWDEKNPDWKRAGVIGKSIGLEWAGDWVTFKEYPHFQLPKE